MLYSYDMKKYRIISGSPTPIFEGRIKIKGDVYVPLSYQPMTQHSAITWCCFASLKRPSCCSSNGSTVWLLFLSNASRRKPFFNLTLLEIPPLTPRFYLPEIICKRKRLSCYGFVLGYDGFFFNDFHSSPLILRNVVIKIKF